MIDYLQHLFFKGLTNSTVIAGGKAEEKYSIAAFRPAPSCAQELDLLRSAACVLPTAAVIYALPIRREAMELVGQFKELNEGWDGYGAYSISSEACETAEQIISSLPYNATTPDIAPSSNGTISLDWYLGDGSVHLEIGKTMFSIVSRPKAGKKIFLKGNTKQLPPIQGLLVAPSQSGSPTSTVSEIAA